MWIGKSIRSWVSIYKRHHKRKFARKFLEVGQLENVVSLYLDAQEKSDLFENNDVTAFTRALFQKTVGKHD